MQHSDIVGFTALASTLSPEALMRHLNSIYSCVKIIIIPAYELPVCITYCFPININSAFDAIVATHGLYKLETVGDAYIVAGGLFEANSSDLAMTRFGVRDLGTVAIPHELIKSHQRPPNSRRVLPSPPPTNISKNAQSAAVATRARMDTVLDAAINMQVRTNTSVCSGYICI